MLLINLMSTEALLIFMQWFYVKPTVQHMQVADTLSSIYIFIQVFAVMPYVRCGLNTRVYDHCETVQNTKHVAAVQFKKIKCLIFIILLSLYHF